MASRTLFMRILWLLIILTALATCTSSNRPPAPTSEPMPTPEPTPTAAPAMLEPTVSHGGPARDYVSLIDNLRGAGASVEPAGTISSEFFSVPGEAITVDGAQVHVFEYADAAQAEAEAAYISPDGATISVPDPSDPDGGRLTLVEWIGTPHFYRRDRLIVQYIGDDAAIANVLEAALGPQFAGGAAPLSLPITPAPTPTARQASTPTPAQGELEQGRKALLAYLSLLHDRRYAQAATYYGGSYDVLRDWNPGVAPQDYAALFENGCTINGLMCLEVKSVVQEELVSSHEFKFVVEFTHEDGTLFVRGPCCGATETEMPPQSQFLFTVKKVGDRFQVQELPVYAP